MRVFPLLAVFVFSTIGISALAIDDSVDVGTTIENNEGSAPIISDEVSGDLYSDISMDESLNTKDKGEDGEDEEGTDTKSELSDVFAGFDAQNTEEKDGEGKGDDGEDSKGKDKFSNLFAELNVQNTRGEEQQTESGQAATETSTATEEAAPQQQPQAEVSEPLAEDKPSRWSLYLEFWEEDQFGSNLGLETYATIRPQYQLTDKLRVGYSLEFTVNWGVLGPDNDETRATMGNHYLMFSTSTALGPFDLFGYVRIYLPTSESWIQRGQIARVRIKPYLTLPISRDVKLTFRLETNYFQHTVDSYRDIGDIGNNDCNSARYCSGINEQWRIEPMLGFMGKIYGPFSFESIHGFRFHNRFENRTVDNDQERHEIMWYNESGITWDVNVGGVPVTLLAGFYDHRKTGGAFWKRLPIISYFTGPIEESWWVFSIWASI